MLHLLLANQLSFILFTAYLGLRLVQSKIPINISMRFTFILWLINTILYIFKIICINKSNEKIKSKEEGYLE